MAHLGRRQPFKPIINRIRIAAPVRKPFIAALPSSQARLAATRRPFKAIIQGQIRSAPSLFIGRSYRVSSAKNDARTQHELTYTTTTIISGFKRTLLRTAIVVPPLIQHDPKTNPRSVRHEQYVARILNSLLRQGEIVQEAGEVAGGRWHLGVHPTNPGDWEGNLPPTNLLDAIDRIAEALRVLGVRP